MATDIKLEKFEGPLDLLLQLIEQEKLSITEISLSTVTEQFVQYLEKIEKDRSDELADFLVVATKLVYLKSRVLLPYLHPEEEEDGPSLADQLKMYQQYVEASKKIMTFWMHNRIAYGRMEPPIKVKDFVLPANSTVNDLHTVFTRLLTRLKPVNPLPRMSIDKGVTVRQKIESILSALKMHKKMSFNTMLGGSENRTDMIVSFLALLELVRDNRASVHQDSTYGDMELKIV